MTEYDINFAKKLAETASGIVVDGIESIYAQRTVLYLSLLSGEIALKALLEKAGKPISEIRRRSHNLRQLLRDIDVCEVEVEIASGEMRWCSASRLRAVVVDQRYGNATIGVLLNSDEVGASRYPGEVRYGDMLRHYPVDVMAKMAVLVCEWANNNWNTIRIPNFNP